MQQDLRGENVPNPSQEHKMAQPVPKIKQRDTPPQSQNQSYQSYPPSQRSRISAVTILLSIIVIILLIGIIISVTSLSSEIDEINDELKETEEEYDDLVVIVESNDPPQASFIPETTNPYQTEKITFDGSGSNDVDGEIIEYKWDFGNQDFASGAIVEYSYDDIGTYTIMLTVKDNNNTVASKSETITVSNAIIITITEASQETYDPEDYTIILTFKNNGVKTANTEEAYWSLQTTDESLYTPDYLYGQDYVIGSDIEDFEFKFYNVVGTPDKLIYNDPPFHQEVDIDI